MTDPFYTSPDWLDVRARVLARDGSVCVLHRFTGGSCSGPLHVHHIRARTERPDLELDTSNLVTCCEAHHPTLEAFRRMVCRLRNPVEQLGSCGHVHRYREGRLACLRQRARERGIVLDEHDLVAA